MPPSYRDSSSSVSSLALAESTSPLRLTPMRVLISSVRYCFSVFSAASRGVPRSATVSYFEDDGDETSTKRLVSTSSGERKKTSLPLVVPGIQSSG